MNTQLFGITYLDTEDFHHNAALFGAEMSMCDYPDNDTGNIKLLNALAAASRMIDAFCGKDFSPANKSETHRLDIETWQFRVNNPPVAEIVSCRIRYAIDGALTIQPGNVFINNQKNYLEITRALDGGLTILENLGTEITGPQVEIIYKSRQDIPQMVRLACGFQTAHLINNGFVDKMLPQNFGKVDLSGLSVNNKKGYKSAEEKSAGSMSAEAERLLLPEKVFSIS